MIMTIDEAIAHAKEVAEKKYLQGMLCHANPNDSELDRCIECGREHEQLAEWLQELKLYREIGTLEEVKDALARKMDNVHISEWIPYSDRLPNKEEYLKDGGRFILDDGNRRYQGLFDIYDGKFKFAKHISGLHYKLFEDNCVIAWMPLPEPYRKE